MTIYRDKSPGRRLWHFTLIIMITLAAGCASAPTNTADSVTEASPESAQQSLLKGDKALRTGDLDRALLEYVRALHYEPENVEALYKIGSVHSAKGNQDVAETSYRKVLAIESGHTGAQEGLGIVLLRERKYIEAKQHLAAAVAADPSRWQAQNGLGIIFDLDGDHARSEKHYLSALQTKPTSAMVLNNLGYNQYLSEAWQAAESYYKRALANDPDNQKAWSNLGLMHARLQQYPQAINAFSQIMEKPQALNNVGYLCMLDGKHEDAERFFAEAIKLSPSYYTLAYENLAQLRAQDRSSEFRSELLGIDEAVTELTGETGPGL